MLLRHLSAVSQRREISAHFATRLGLKRIVLYSEFNEGGLDWAEMKHEDTKNMETKLRVGDIVTVPIKNRWGIECAATIEAVRESSVDANGLEHGRTGADRFVTGIPFDVITPT